MSGGELRVEGRCLGAVAALSHCGLNYAKKLTLTFLKIECNVKNMIARVAV